MIHGSLENCSMENCHHAFQSGSVQEDSELNEPLDDLWAALIRLCYQDLESTVLAMKPMDSVGHFSYIIIIWFNRQYFSYFMISFVYSKYVIIQLKSMKSNSLLTEYYFDIFFVRMVMESTTLCSR